YVRLLGLGPCVWTLKFPYIVAPSWPNTPRIPPPPADLSKASHVPTHVPLTSTLGCGGGGGAVAQATPSIMTPAISSRLRVRIVDPFFSWPRMPGFGRIVGGYRVRSRRKRGCGGAGGGRRGERERRRRGRRER